MTETNEYSKPKYKNMVKYLNNAGILTETITKENADDILGKFYLKKKQHIDPNQKQVCFCGKKNLKFYYYLINSINGDVLICGKSCRKTFIPIDENDTGVNVGFYNRFSLSFSNGGFVSITNWDEYIQKCVEVFMIDKTTAEWNKYMELYKDNKYVLKYLTDNKPIDYEDITNDRYEEISFKKYLGFTEYISTRDLLNYFNDVDNFKDGKFIRNDNRQLFYSDRQLKLMEDNFNVNMDSYVNKLKHTCNKDIDIELILDSFNVKKDIGRFYNVDDKNEITTFWTNEEIDEYFSNEKNFNVITKKYRHRFGNGTYSKKQLEVIERVLEIPITYHIKRIVSWGDIKNHSEENKTKFQHGFYNKQIIANERGSFYWSNENIQDYFNDLDNYSFHYRDWKVPKNVLAQKQKEQTRGYDIIMNSVLVNSLAETFNIKPMKIRNFYPQPKDKEEYLTLKKMFSKEVKKNFKKKYGKINQVCWINSTDKTLLYNREEYDKKMKPQLDKQKKEREEYQQQEYMRKNYWRFKNSRYF